MATAEDRNSHDGSNSLKSDSDPISSLQAQHPPQPPPPRQQSDSPPHNPILSSSPPPPTEAAAATLPIPLHHEQPVIAAAATTTSEPEPAPPPRTQPQTSSGQPTAAAPHAHIQLPPPPPPPIPASPPRGPNINVSSRSRWATRKMTIKSSDNKRRSLLGRLHAKSESQEKNALDMEAAAPDASDAGSANGDNDVADADDDDDDAMTSRMLYFNMPLPSDLLDSDGHPVQSFPRNKVRTAKYTPISFIPKNLWFQFHNVANIFFLFLVILVFFPIFGGVNPGLNAVPLIIIIAITAIKDAYEDYKRTVLDIELNNAPVHRLCHWNNVNVEDDNVSDWRKFKKANSRFFGWIWLVIQSLFSPKAKDKRRAQRQAKLEAQADELPRPSVESRRTRVSMALNRASMQLGRHSLAHDDIQMTPVPSPAPRDSAEAMNDARRQAAIRTMTKDVVNRQAQARGAVFKQSTWKALQVGDFVRIYNNDELPADVLIMATSERDGACYVETKNLDGETNLKVRSALQCGRQMRHARDCERAQFVVESEQPHPNLYKYNAAIRWSQHLPFDPDGEPEELTEPIGIDNLLLRGCNLRNTEWVLGVVLFTGKDTKIMMNSGQTPTKRSRMAREMNMQIVINFAILFVMCLVAAIVNGVAMGRDQASRAFFDGGTIGGTAGLSGFITFWAAIILLQNLVPISLYVTLEIVRTLQALFIYSDVEMYDEGVNEPCVPKSWNISDDVGQIEYVFSDKTGTLTQNVMEFKKATVNGQPYGEAYTEAQAGMRKRMGIDVEAEAARVHREIAEAKVKALAGLRALHDNPFLHDDKITFIAPDFVADLGGESGQEQQKATQQFMLALALCHTVIAERAPGEPPMMEFKAQSPDEAALVATARDMGFTVLGSTQDTMRLNVMGDECTYRILNVIEFNSSRKRMSAIVRMPDDRIVLFCKGADSIIYSRLKKGEQREMRLETAEHLEMFAREGLRTLCIAQRDLTDDEYYAWKREHDLAAAAIDDREDKLEAVADVIERELTLLGGTAIEDRLQDGVPDTIALLADAGIKLWVLTGDKVETAINIGFSCNLLNNDMELINLKLTEEEEVAAPPGGGGGAADVEERHLAELELELDRHLANFGISGSDEDLEHARGDHRPPPPTHALIIDGSALKWVLHDALKQKFLLLCKQCKSVLCCRVSPAQKAAVVAMVKNGLDVMTLSIGDGANDVAMIQQADVGVGIAGHEGRQAAMSSDYAIAQFRFLQRLILVHGRWSYRRLAEAIPNFFYKNMVWTFAIFWYQVFCDFDMTYVFDYVYVLCFAVVFTSLPVGVMGVLDQDVSDRVSLAVPQLYRRGIERLEWTPRKFWLYMLDGIYQSVMVFFIPYLVMHGTATVTTSGHSVGDIPRFGSYVAHPAIVTVNIYILMNTYRWDWLILLLVALSSLAVFAVTGIYTSLSVSEQFLNGATQVYAQPSFWISFFMTPIICLMPRFAIKAIQKVYFPYDVDIIREKEARGDYSTLDKDGRDRSHLRTGSRASNASADGGALPQQQQQHPMIKHGQNASVDEDSRPIYPPSFLTSNTASRNVRSQTGNGSDSTTFTTGPRDTSLDFGAGAGDSHLHVPGLGLGLPPADAAHQTLAEAPEIDIQAPVDEDDGGRQMALAAAAARLSSGQHQQGLSRMDSAAGRARPSMDRTRLSMDRGRPSIDRARPSYDRMRCSMEPVRNSFEASSDFTSAARLSRIESSQCPAPPVSTSLQRLRLRGLSLSKSANQ